MNDTFDPTLFQRRIKEISGKDSDEVIAEKAGVDRSTVQRWYKNEKYAPRAGTLIRLANAYNCTVDYLLGRDTEGRIEKKDLTVKDVCRMLIAIDEQYPFVIDEGREEPETDLDREYSHPLYDFKEHTHAGVILQFSPHVQPVKSAPDDYEYHGDTAATIYINDFLHQYMRSRSILENDPDFKTVINDHILNKVCEDRAPKYEQKDKR